MASRSTSPKTPKPPLQHASKSAAAPAAVDNDTVEMKDIIRSGPEEELPLKDDIIKLAMHGDEAGVKALLDSGKARADFQDAEGNSPLHWAAINNRYGTCKLLLDRGADPNVSGGESVATPAMWAAQRGHYYIVNLLLTRGADPTLTDVHGYNMLHLATFDGNVLLILLLLHQGIPVDSRDTNQHTSLMWAAYKGWPACVDIFLRWGADISAVDDSGFTALHWALVRGNYQCIQKLIEYGADRFTANNEGKTPATVAEELKTQRVWWDALEECGYDRDGNPLYSPNSVFGFQVKDRNMVLKRFFFFLPFLETWVVVQCFCYMPWFLAFPSVIFLVVCMQFLASKVLKVGPPGMRTLHRTPFLTGIFAGTAFWVAIRWVWAILPNTFWIAPFSNIFFFIFFGSCLYFYAVCMIYDPGFVPKLTGKTEQKKVVTELLSLWKYDEQNFCVLCMDRMPLRSKHCRRCNRCVAKHDHHCPWVFNCVGAANHRQFFLYIACLEIGLMFLVRLLLLHFENLPTPEDHGPYECAVASEILCRPLWLDPFTLYVCVWGILQSTWVTMLLFVQLMQIARAQTTYESMHASRHGSFPHDHKPSTAIATAIATGSTSLEGAAIDSAPPRGPDLGPGAGGGSGHHGHSHGHSHEGCFTRIKKLLGVDAFVSTTSNRQNRRRENPFSTRVTTNCADFWCAGGPAWKPPMEGGMGTEGLLGGKPIDWSRVYETPKLMRMGRGGYERVEQGDDMV